MVDVIVAAMREAQALDIATPVHAFMQYADHDHSVGFFAKVEVVSADAQSPDSGDTFAGEGKSIGIFADSLQSI